MKFKAQSLTEIAVCLAAVTAAILGMQVYLQRGLMARQKGAIEHAIAKMKSGIKEEAAETSGKYLLGIIQDLSDNQGQYEPYYRSGSITETSGGGVKAKHNVIEKMPDGSKSIKIFTGRGGAQTIGPAKDD